MKNTATEKGHQLTPENSNKFSVLLNLNLLVCLLGNFVDQYDLFLFSSIRLTSLLDLGLNPQEALASGIFLLNCQLVGMLLGGIIGGVIGDKRGRLTVLFGSIILYSLANLANASVHTVNAYAICRFLSGLGLAGEIGASITIILETLPKNLRGYGTMLLMAFGHCAAITAAIVSNLVSWRVNFLIGGLMGLGVLLLRFKARESEMFLEVATSNIARGDFFSLFSDKRRLIKFVKGISVATPTWFAFTILVMFAPEIAHELGVKENIQPEKYMPIYFGALICGDLLSGLLGQFFRTRKWVIFANIAAICAVTLIYLNERSLTLNQLYILIAAFGFVSGYTVLSFATAAEQFGTNIRATVATSTPNLVRASAIIFTSLFALLKIRIGIVPAAAVVGAISLCPALISALTLSETFGKNLNYTE